ncbi:TonB-dependent receptor [Parabacteroides johnsonii]|uniref:TonB-dependent receptor n=1 Tax=Parabacteroides johnsonii TaxID=387661 RepID=UPI00242CEA25|nr:TonB-dependent receptor [Parabacteroides johnsonii]
MKKLFLSESLPKKDSGRKQICRVMKLTASFLLLCSCFAFAGHANSQNAKVSLNKTKVQLQEILNEIEEQTDYLFISNRDVNLKQKVSVSAKDESVQEVLSEVLKNTGLTFKVEGVNIILSSSTGFNIIQQDKKTISGRVVDRNGEPVIGVNVVEKGTTNGTITDMDGKFSFNVSPNATLMLSYIGYKAQEIAVNNRTQYNVVLDEDTETLDEVVVVGYGTMKKSSLTGSVTKVETEKLEGFPSVNVVDALQGRAAGVYINPSRQPGEDPTIRIRGTRSFNASNSPLLIVDGMPGSWENVSSEDIESMEILKDAAATAVYGSRAANGVILITTKSAKKGGKLSIELNSYVGMNKYDFIEMQSPEKYNAMIRDVMRYQSHGLDKEAWENSDIDLRRGLEMFNGLWADNYYNKGITFNWQDALFNSHSVTTGHNISIGQATDKISYKLSYSFQDDNSYYKTMNYKRHILNNNVKINLAKWMDLGLITRLSLRDMGGWPGSMWENYRRMSPFETPYIDEDPSKGLKDVVGKEKYVNALLNYQDGNFVNDRINKRADIILTANIRPFSWLTFTTNLKLDYKESSNGKYYDSKTSEQNLGYNFASFNKGSDSGYTWNGILNFDKSFGSHHLMATAVLEAQQSKGESVEASSQDIPAKYMDYHFLSSGIVNQKVSSNYWKSNLLSYMFRLQYEYKDRYLFNVAVRTDGSSKLADGNKWRSFPSAAVAWRVSEEGFLKDSKVVSNLKLRLSYGEIGNQAIDSYQTMTRLKSKTYSWAGNGFYTWQPDGLANKGLGWEVSKTWNAGVDFGLFDNLLGGTVEFYHTRNEDLLLTRTLPETTGFGSLWQNIGTTQNHGVEATINVYPVRGKDLNWSLTATATRNWNKIVELLDGKDDRGASRFVGQPISVFFNYEKIGIWQLDELEEAKKYKQEPGQIKIKDVDEDGKITDNDKVIIGQKEPKVIASIQNSLVYKDWDFSFNLVGQFGHIIEAGNYIAEWNADKMIINNVDWWTPLNPTNEWPRVQTAQSQDYTSTLSKFKGDFIKLQDISIGYNFKRLLAPVCKVEKLRLYFQARNLFYLYRACPGDINPEQPNSVYTLPTSLVVGLNFAF